MEKPDHSKCRQPATRPHGVTTYKITIHNTFLREIISRLPKKSTPSLAVKLLRIQDFDVSMLQRILLPLSESLYPESGRCPLPNYRNLPIRVYNTTL